MSIRCLRALAMLSLLAACASPAPIELRDMGSFRGNSHLMMMDKNNLGVADVIQTWLEREHLWR